MEDHRHQIDQLAGLLRVRNELDVLIAKLIGRPATVGNIGEFVASRIFDIELSPTGVQAGYDGVFRSGSLAGKTVNVKTASRSEGYLDIGTHPADYYLALVGARASARATALRTLPLSIREVYLFEMESLRRALADAGVKTGVATSVRRHLWEAARVYPPTDQSVMTLSEDQVALLRLLEL